MLKERPMPDAQKIRFHCPRCSKSVSVAVQHAGKQGKCPGCKSVITIPIAASPLPEENRWPDVKALVEQAEKKGEVRDSQEHLTQKEVEKIEESFRRRFAASERHFVAAEGSFLERLFIAAAMSAIEDDDVQRQRLKLSSEDQMVFMMTYECFVIWSLMRGMETVLKQEEVKSACFAMQRHFAKQAWYRPHVFEKIWDGMQVFMPMAMKYDDTHPPYPVAEMLMAADYAGCSLPSIGTDFRFGIHVGLTMVILAEFGRQTAKEHITLNQT
jgi:hypothetical protein